MEQPRSLKRRLLPFLSAQYSKTNQKLPRQTESFEQDNAAAKAKQHQYD